MYMPSYPESTSTVTLTVVQVAQVRIIFELIDHLACPKSPPLAYMQMFMFVGWKNREGILLEEPGVDMYLLRWHFCSVVSPTHEPIRMGDVIQLTDIQHTVDIIPVFGQVKDSQINSSNALELSNTFYLNNFSSKELYHILLSDFM